MTQENAQTRYGGGFLVPREAFLLLINHPLKPTLVDLIFESYGPEKILGPDTVKGFSNREEHFQSYKLPP